MFPQGANPKLLGAFEVLIEVGAVTAEAFGQAKRCPVGDLVEGALMDCRVVETLGKQGPEAVDTLPLGGQFAQGEAEAMAGEIGAAVRVVTAKRRNWTMSLRRLAQVTESQPIHSSRSLRRLAAPAQQNTATSRSMPLCASCSQAPCHRTCPAGRPALR